jgi:hypothetical protein
MKVTSLTFVNSNGMSVFTTKKEMQVFLCLVRSWVAPSDQQKAKAMRWKIGASKPMVMFSPVSLHGVDEHESRLTRSDDLNDR